jgi:hypothetical protein
MKLNEEYSINSGQGTIVFTEGNKGTVNAEYEIQGNKGKGKINGTLENNILSGTYHVDSTAGLIEFTFTENGFDAKWKQGIEPGPMKGKWTGSLKSHSVSNQSINEKTSLSPEQLKWFEEDTWEFENLPKEWFESKEFMLAVVTNSGGCLEYASDKLKDDKEIVLAAVTKSGRDLQYASDKLKDDKEIVLAAVNKSGSYLQYASDKLKDDREIVLAAFDNYGGALEYASDKLKDDREIVLAALYNNGRALEYASDKLKDDREIVLAALDNNGRALEYASDKLKDDREIILDAVKKDGRTLSDASDNLKNNREIVLEAIKNYPSSIEYASDELIDDLEIVFTALSQDSSALYYVRSEAILKELAENSSVGGTKINFKVRYLVTAVQKHFEKKLFDENGDVKDELETICNDWYDFNQIIYQNQTMDGDALLSLAQVQFNEYRPIPTDGREVEEYTRDLLNEAIELNDECLEDIICHGLLPEEYLDFSDLSEKACELLWNRGEKNYANALIVLRNNDSELIPGLSDEFVVQIIQEARDSDIGEEEDKEEFENFVSEAGLE